MDNYTVKGYSERRGRSYRRHQRDRVVAKAQQVVSRWADADSVNDQAVRLADNLCACSCWLCIVEPAKPRAKQWLSAEDLS